MKTNVLDAFTKETERKAQELKKKIDDNTVNVDDYREMFERMLTQECYNDAEAMERIKQETPQPAPEDFMRNIMYDQDVERPYDDIAKDTMPNFY